MPVGYKKGQLIILDSKSLLQANAYMLNNCEEMESYRSEHGEQLKKDKRKRKWNEVKDQSEDFLEWFTGRAMEEDVPGWLQVLSKGPNKVVKTFSAYLVNGKVFIASRNLDIVMMTHSKRFLEKSNPVEFVALVDQSQKLL
ncbi:hypothetical protein PIB30_109672 [Stylosanthes scabra]|uniref:Uncharacterized protein n=1 Tax=Stylosanthes scabra TaxID=79078 RepID=A0ABU6Y0G9_9FABA|nr:hypothetical protein [Stylosanthes scabra]